ncbi:MAG: hypothetical protein LC793_05250 [Thermomicrobia bacterium]|nr:hypothetical protein [Thermomicrobia bacterium]
MKKGGGAAGAIFAVFAIVRVIILLVSHSSQSSSNAAANSFRSTDFAYTVQTATACAGHGGFFIQQDYSFDSTCVVPSTRTPTPTTGTGVSGTPNSSGTTTTTSVLSTPSIAGTTHPTASGAAESAAGLAGTTTGGGSVTTWTDPDGRLSLRYDSTWALQPNPAGNSSTLLTLDHAGSIRFYVNEYETAVSLQDDAQTLPDRLMKDLPDYTFIAEPVTDAQIGGQPAKQLIYRQHSKTNPVSPESLTAVYFVDHGFGGVLDPLLDSLGIVLVVFRGVLFVVDVTPCRAHVFRRVNRVFVIRWIREGDVPVLARTLVRVGVVSLLDAIAHWMLLSDAFHRPPESFALSMPAAIIA